MQTTYESKTHKLQKLLSPHCGDLSYLVYSLLFLSYHQIMYLSNLAFITFQSIVPSASKIDPSSSSKPKNGEYLDTKSLPDRSKPPPNKPCPSSSDDQPHAELAQLSPSGAPI